MFDGGDGGLVGGHRPGARGSVAINAYLSRIVMMMAEMEQGRRPVAALDTIASPLAARRIRHQVREAQIGARPGRGQRRLRTTPTSVRSMNSFHPSAGVTEGVVVVECERRSRAYCVRLEQEGDHWRLVELATPDGELRAAVTEASRTGAVPLDEHGQRRSSGRDGAGYSVPRWGPGDGATTEHETEARLRAARRRSRADRGTGGDRPTVDGATHDEEDDGLADDASGPRQGDPA